MMSDDMGRKNRRAARWVFGFVFAMILLSFASVPLYRLFCQATGYDGTPKIDPNAKAEKVLDRDITIRFNADIAQGMPWRFEVERKDMVLKIGEKGFVSFYAKNNAAETVEGTAIFNVLPEAAGRYFHKTQCFCFGRQELLAGADAHMPVAFFVDPAIVDDPDIGNIKEITLSYTFFKADSKALENALQALYNSPNSIKGP